MTSRVGSGPPPIGEEDLQAYVDGQLDARRRSAVEGYLAAHPDEALRVEAYRRQNIGLHALFDARPAAEPDRAPVDELRRRLTAALERQRLFRRAARGLAASAALVVGVAVLGWWSVGTDGWRGERRLVAADDAPLGPDHPASPQGALPVAAGDGGVTAAAPPAGLGGWLARHMAGGGPEEWPNLRPLGLRLVGERATATTDGLAVQLAYEDAEGRGFVLHIERNGGGRPAAAAAPPPMRAEEVAFFWRSGPFVLGLVGEARREELLPIAEAVAAQMIPVGAPPAPGRQVPLLPADADPAAPEMMAGAPAAPPPSSPALDAPETAKVQEADVGDAAVVEPAAPETDADGDAGDGAAAADGGSAAPVSQPAETAPPAAGGDPEDGESGPEDRRPLSGLPQQVARA